MDSFLMITLILQHQEKIKFLLTLLLIQQVFQMMLMYLRTGQQLTLALLRLVLNHTIHPLKPKPLQKIVKMRILMTAVAQKYDQ